MRDGRRMLILAICCLSLFMVGLDNTIVNIALPAIRTDLDASVSGLQWTIDVYTLVLASLLMLGGSTADRIGRRRIFQTGLLLFTAGSLLCGLAPGLGWLIAFRVVQAIGGSMLNPVAMSIVTNTLPRTTRARAGHRRVGCRLRHKPRPRARARRVARPHCGLARHLLDQCARRAGRHGTGPAVRAGVARAAPAPGRSARPGPGHRPARLAELRDHRRTCRRLGVRPDRRRVHRRRRRAARPARLRAPPPGATDRTATSFAAPRSRVRPASRWWRCARWPACCS